MALVRVPFYFINLLPTSLLYISLLLKHPECNSENNMTIGERARASERARERESERERESFIRNYP